MTIQTEITLDDWQAFVRFVAQKTGKPRWGGTGDTLIALAVFVPMGAVYGYFGGSIDFPSVLFGVVGCVVWFAAMLKLGTRRTMPTDSYLLGPRQVTLAEDGVRETTTRHEAVFRWSGVQGAEIVDQHLFIVLDGPTAITIPRRTFASGSEQVEFVNEIEKRIGRRS